MTESDNLESLEKAVLEKLAAVDINRYQYTDYLCKFVLETKKWYAEVRSFQGKNQIECELTLAVRVNYFLNGDPELVNGDTYKFSGQEVKSFYNSLAERRETYLGQKREKERAAKTKDIPGQQGHAQKILKVFLCEQQD
ncbi:MAG: hypothetical protein Q7S55_02490 [Nanoarchaeota archaeon]|nr:hypothetical protein [Nanoarchaeota archaeon]